MGFFVQGRRLSELSSGTLAAIIKQVSFPLLSSVKNDKTQFIIYFKKTIKLAAFVNVPLMLMMSVLAEPIIIVIFGDKWLMAVPLLRWLSLAKAMYSLTKIHPA